MSTAVQTITPFLWFDDAAEEAAESYVSASSARRGGASREDTRIVDVSRYGEAGPGPAGTAMTVTFRLEGRGSSR